MASPGNSLAAQDARQRINAAAFRLFSQKGYSCTSVQDIADAAGVQKSILYYYFESKEALYSTLLTESASRLRGLLDVALTAAGISCPMSAMLATPMVGSTPSPAPRRSKPRTLPAGTSVTRLLGRFVETLLAAARDNREPVRFFMAHMFAPDADRPLVCSDDMQEITPRITYHLVKLGQARGELRGDPDLLERLLLGAVQYSITRHLRSPEQEPLKPGTGQRIVGALLRGFAGQKEKRPAGPKSTRAATKSPPATATKKPASRRKSDDRKR